MRTSRSATSLVLLLGAAVACGEDSAGPSQDDIVGTWEATVMEFVSVSAPVDTVDLIADGGSATLVLAANGTYTFTVTPVGDPPDVQTGTWELGGEVMTVSPTGLPFSYQFDVVLAGDTLSLSGADAEYDFDGDDVPEAAKLNLVLVR